MADKIAVFNLNQYNQQRQREKKRWIYPVHLAMYATYLRNNGWDVKWDSCSWIANKRITSEEQIDVPFLDLPPADRELTDALNPKWQQNGNFKYHPGTYIQSSNTCWWKKCSFCKETDENKEYQLRPVKDVIDEVLDCRMMGFKEIFDDSGTFPTGYWLQDFCRRFDGSNTIFGCNARFGKYSYTDYLFMRDGGFRMLLYGLESANQFTLYKLNKGIIIEDAIDELKMVSKLGFEPHIAVMFGYPWETEEDAMNTVNLVKMLLRKGYAKTAQASLYRPKEGITNAFHKKYVNKFYEVGFDPRFWFRKIIDIRTKEDIQYLIRGVKEGWNALIAKNVAVKEGKFISK